MPRKGSIVKCLNLSPAACGILDRIAKENGMSVSALVDRIAILLDAKPDLLPSDLIANTRLNPRTGKLVDRIVLYADPQCQNNPAT